LVCSGKQVLFSFCSFVDDVLSGGEGDLGPVCCLVR